MGKEKRRHSRMGVKPCSDCTGNGGCHIVPCDHIYWQVVYQLSPFSGTSLWCIDLLKSHICSRVHFSTQDQPKRSSFTVYHMVIAIERVVS